MEISTNMLIIISALASGAVVGAVPAICGAIRGKTKLAILGFITCMACSLILGLFLSIPACIAYMYFIYRGDDKKKERLAEYEKYMGEE